MESGVGVGNCVLVGLFELIETIAVIKLSADVLVLVHEVIQLLGEL